MSATPNPEAHPEAGREAQRLRTRQRLYDAAVEVFRRDGVAAASVDEIASRVGVSRGTFYFHFRTKEAVLLKVAEQAELDLCAAIEAAPADLTIEPLLAVIARHIHATWLEERLLFAEVGVVALRGSAARIEERGGARAALSRRFEAAIARGELREELGAEVLADLCLANIFAIAIAWSADATLDLEAALAVAAHVFLHGARG